MMIRLLIADDERLEREALVEMVSRRFEHEVVLETAENEKIVVYFMLNNLIA